LIRTIKNLTVQTRNGSAKLSETVIPGLDSFLEENYPALPILDFTLPVDSSVKRKLATFDINVESNFDYYLACLRHLRTQKVPEIKAVSHIYEQLQHRYDEFGDVME
jgi:hypothetical protein